MFPEDFRIPFGRWVNDAIEWLVTNYGFVFDRTGDAVLSVLALIEEAFRGTPWWLVILIVAALAWHATRSWLAPVLTAAGLLLVGAFGLWDLAMQTLALIVVAVAVCVAIGIPAGILISQNRVARKLVLPLLDVMQTMPSFVYLIPALMLFGLGKVPALLATVIYALPPLVRLTDLGIRQVAPDVVEAAKAFGTTRRQRLAHVELPLAMPSILQGVNQTTMMALAMVVIASMIGARGLGEQVLLGIQRLDFGRGAEAGIAIVVLAIIFDRITQGYGGGRRAARRPSG